MAQPAGELHRGLTQTSLLGWPRKQVRLRVQGHCGQHDHACEAWQEAYAYYMWVRRSDATTARVAAAISWVCCTSR
jgi:hypothetical protein